MMHVGQSEQPTGPSERQYSTESAAGGLPNTLMMSGTQTAATTRLPMELRQHATQL